MKKERKEKSGKSLNMVRKRVYKDLSRMFALSGSLIFLNIYHSPRQIFIVFYSPSPFVGDVRKLIHNSFK